MTTNTGLLEEGPVQGVERPFMLKTYNVSSIGPRSVYTRLAVRVGKRNKREREF